MKYKFKRLLYRIFIVLIFILISISIFLYKKFHPIFLNYNDINQIKINTINNEIHRMKEQEIIIKDKEIIAEILSTINHKFFYNSYCADCLASYKVPSFGTYKIKIGNSKYEIIIPHYVSDTFSFTEGKMENVGVVKFPNEFIIRITQILPPIYNYKDAL